MVQCPAALVVPVLVVVAVVGGAAGLSRVGAALGALRAAPRRALISQAATAAMPSKGRATRTIIPGRGPALGGGSATRLRWVVAMDEAARGGRGAPCCEGCA
jgi:hypothetical protein